MIISIQAESE